MWWRIYQLTLKFYFIVTRHLCDFSTDVKTLFTAYVNVTRAINFRVAAIKPGGREGGSKRGGEDKWLSPPVAGRAKIENPIGRGERERNKSLMQNSVSAAPL